MSANIRDVARMAGVSVGTVSRLLHGDLSVSPERRQKIRQAMEALRYVPRNKPANDHAFPLYGRNIALVLLGMDRSLVSLPIVAEAVHAAEEAISRKGGNVLLADAPRPTPVPPVLTQHIDGVIAKGAMQGSDLSRSHSGILDIISRGPLVWIYGRPEGCQGDAVGANEVTVGELAADALLSRGHRDLAFLNPKTGHALFERRKMAFCHRAASQGARVQVYEETKSGLWTLPLKSVQEVETVMVLVDRMRRQKSPPTAVFVPADNIAALVYRAFNVRNVRVGRDISVISCNNEETVRSALHPDLMSIDIRAQEIGRRAVDQVAWRIEHPEERPVEIGVEPVLVEGNSVRRLK